MNSIRMRKFRNLFITALLGLGMAVLFDFYQTRLGAVAAQPASVSQALGLLQTPPDLNIRLFSDLSALGKPRMLALDSDGQLLVTLVDTGRVVKLDAQGQATIVAEGLHSPNGITLSGENLLIAEPDRVLSLSRQSERWVNPQPLIQGLPIGGHGLKSIKRSPDGFLFINVGSSCNVCIEDDPNRATLHRYTLQGRPAGALVTLGRHAQSPVWARGLRNSQGLAWHPQTGALYATNEGADNRSERKQGPVNDDVPPEHLNHILPGQHYGWPYCWADRQQPGKLFEDPNMPSESGICANAQAPAITLPAHSTPIGITFLHNSRLPADYREDAIVALHGSWNRKQASGYALARVKFRNHQPVEVVEWVSGWLQGQQYWGRPVDVLVGADGMLYISDDLRRWIYQISPAIHQQ